MEAASLGCSDEQLQVPPTLLQTIMVLHDLSFKHERTNYKAKQIYLCNVSSNRATQSALHKQFNT